MYRTYPYAILFVTTALLQVFLFDNLSLSLYFDPLVYLSFIVLLPLDIAPVVLLGAGLATGVGMDMAMGTAGINTSATLLAAFVRPAVVNFCYGAENAREGGTPSPERMGRRAFVRYLAIVILVHHALFFTLEALSLARTLHNLMRILLSGAGTFAASWLLMRLFTAKLPVRI